MDVLKRIQQFFSFWYLRYLLATELYMVESWERATIYALFAFLFGTVWIFNYSIVLSAISQLRSPSDNCDNTICAVHNI